MRANIIDALKVLSQSGVVAYPTETFYGLGVDAHSEIALKRLIKLKGRQERQPFPILLPSTEALNYYAEEIPKVAQTLIQKYWPGPLTLVLKSRKFSSILCGPRDGVGFRVSSHPLAFQLASTFGRCITATSANASCKKPAETAGEVSKIFDDIFILNGGKSKGGLPSTVLDFTQGTRPLLIREGRISWKEIQDIFLESHG